MKLAYLYKSIVNIIVYLFLFYLIGCSIYYLIATILQNRKIAQMQKRGKLKNKLNHEYYIPISILLYTYNNEKKIVKKVKNLLKLNYKLYEIIIIDDGSSDKTIDVLKKAFSLKKIEKPIHKQLKTKKIKEVYQADEQNISITLLKKEHNGCMDAFNAGINASSYPYFISIKENYTLEKYALENLIRPILENDKVMVCKGNVMVGSLTKENTYKFPKGMLAKGEVTEYNNDSISISKSINTKLPSLTLFKKDIVVSSLEYEDKDIGENFERIEKIKKYCKLQNMEYIEKNAIHAVAFLEVTDKIIPFMKERKEIHKSLQNYTAKYKCIFPILKVIGFIITIIACTFHIVTPSSILLFIISYILFCSFLSLINFITRLAFENIKISILDFIKVFFCSMIEQTVIKVLLTLTALPF